MTNTSQLDDASYTYLWTVTQSDSNTSYTDTASNPSFTLSDPGSWDVLLDITSSTECSIEPESVSGMVTVGGGIGFTTDFDGVLCNGQSITLENNSVQQSGFQWDIEGATIISDPSAQDAITFVYGEDQEDVSWSLIYTGNGCDTTYTEIHNVDVDLIVPLLSNDLNLFSCNFDTIIQLSSLTELDNNPSDQYEFIWSIIDFNEDFGSVSPQTIIDTNPSFEFTSTQGQSYSVNLRINNINTSCYGEDTFDNLLNQIC